MAEAYLVVSRRRPARLQAGHAQAADGRDLSAQGAGVLSGRFPGETMKIRIQRYDPDRDARPYMKEYDVPVEASDRMLLDVLVKVKSMDHEVAFRRSCREGVCGSD